MFQRVSTVMYFATDPEKSARWWADALGVGSVHTDVDGDSVYAWFTIAGVEHGFHQADDERNPRGASPVVYWQVDDLDAARKHLLDAGAVHHRGPLTVEPGRRICQLTDPFGAVVGLEGP